MKNVKASNNLRDTYIRGITLGGQDEVIYEAAYFPEQKQALPDNRFPQNPSAAFHNDKHLFSSPE